jgi:hypothetical protein
MAYDLRQITLDDVGTRTALIARVEEDDNLGTMPDDEPALFTFYDAALLRIVTLCNLITDLTPSDDGKLDIPQDIIPRRLWTALTLFVVKEWFKGIGKIDLGNFYEGEFNKEISTYRFNPDKPTVATRPFRAF